MEQEKQKTLLDFFQTSIKALETMTQEQIEACAWIMGGGQGWTKTNLINAYELEIERYSKR